MADAPFLYVNGLFLPAGQPSLSPLDRGFTLADGIFETMVARGTGVFRLEDHLARLAEGARLLELPLPPGEALAAAVAETLRRNGFSRSVVRLTVTRGVDPGRGLAVPSGLIPTVVIRATPRESGSSLPAGLRVVVASLRRDEASPLSRVKSLAYTAGVLARLEARRAGADDALLLNTQGRLAGGTSSTLFLVLEDRLLTPPVEEGALPGVSRRALLELAQEGGIPAAEAPLTLADLGRAGEAFLTNVVTGPVAIVALGDRPLGAGIPGPFTQRLAAAYAAVVEAGPA